MTQNEINYIHLLMKLHKLLSEGSDNESIREEMEIIDKDFTVETIQQMNSISEWCQDLLGK